MEIVTDVVVAGPRSLRIVRPADAEALVDEAAFARDEFLPYWAELWPAGVALARHVAAGDLAGARVLELGCGLGLPSIVAALAGAHVIATDWSDAALALLEENAWANAATLTVARLDWRRPGALGRQRFDLVLAADVLYEARNAEPLLAVLERAVAAGGEALVADPGRRHAAPFLERAAERGWLVDAAATDELPRGAVYRLWRE